MNRAERRNLKKNLPGYKTALDQATAAAVDNLERMFREKWEDDETLNGGDIDMGIEDYGEDEIYND